MISALLYKDATVLWKNGKTLLMILVPFLIVGAIQPYNSFFAIYPAAAMCTMALNSLSYDERYGWDRYAGALPYGRRNVVTAKYLLSLLSTGAAAALYLLVGLGFCALHGGLAGAGRLLPNLWLLLGIATVYSAVMLPIAFRFGLEKARVLYIIVICGVIIASMYVPVPGTVLPLSVGQWALGLGLIALCGALWVLSWGISVRIYRKKEL